MDNIILLRQYCAPLKLLYVEDDVDLHKSVLRYLSKLFDNIDSAFNGEEGLQKYQSESYDIVLSDIKMPKLNGLEMSKKIKEVNPDQTIIILSAHTESNYFLDSIHIGVSDYILKPIDYKQMNSVLYKVSNILYIKKDNENYHKNLAKLVEEQASIITQNYEETLIAMVDLIESRDTYTGGHSQRVAKYSKMIATKMGLTDDECNLIYRASMLHDIGKITTPDNVLLKPGKLSDIEYSLIKNHVTESYRLLSKIPMYKEISTIVSAHHERYDGSGYPNQLKENEIPLLSKIMIIADSFDAMTTNRIYKGRMSVSDSIDEIKNESGTQFDPEIVPFACGCLKNIVLPDNISQSPINNMDQQRFSYFFKDYTTKSYNKEYLEYMLQDGMNSYKYYICLTKNFSQYNKNHGWDEGDLLLRSVASYLQSISEKNMVFRIHGDDFVILMEESTIFNIDNDIQPDFLKDTNVELYLYEISKTENILEHIQSLKNER